MKEIIIFCQAPADIKYALSLYDKYKDSSQISVFCVNVEGMYKFVKSLKLNIARLIYIPYDFKLSFKNLIKIINTKLNLAKIYKKYFSRTQDYEIYFFSHFFDFVTFYMLHRLNKSNKIRFINHYDDKASKYFKRPSISFRLLIIRYIYKIMTGINFDFYKRHTGDKHYFIEFPYADYGIKEIKENILRKEVYKKYSYRVVANKKGKRVLLLEMDYKKVNIFNNYENTTKKIINRIKSEGFEIYIKPHPRLGHSYFLDDINVNFIEKYVPAEFIDEDIFDLIIGISSVALAYFAEKGNKKVISLINVYNYKFEEDKQRSIEYLNDLSGNVYFAKSLHFFE